MHEEEFAQGSSAIHKLDPRLKIVLAAAFSIVVAVLTRWEPLTAALAGAVILVSAARIDMVLVLKRLLIVNIFVLLLWVFLPFSTPGAELVLFGPLTATREGVHAAAQITLKSNTIVLAGMALLSTTSLVSLGHALSSLRVPNKLVQLFFFTVRYAYTIHEEYLRLRNTLKVRCFRPRTDFHTYHTYACLVANLLVSSFERSSRILWAMKCRGFKTGFPVMSRFHFHTRDIVFVLLFVPFLVLVGVVQWTRMLL
jgi:cobalt/nickel transport system permease protein